MAESRSSSQSEGSHWLSLVPATLESQHLAEAKGWLDDEDDFFGLIDQIVEDREGHIPRVFRGQIKR